MVETRELLFNRVLQITDSEAKISPSSQVVIPAGDHAEGRRDFAGRRAQGRHGSRNSDTPGGHMSAGQCGGNQNPEVEGQ